MDTQQDQLRAQITRTTGQRPPFTVLYKATKPARLTLPSDAAAPPRDSGCVVVLISAVMWAGIIALGWLICGWLYLLKH